MLASGAVLKGHPAPCLPTTLDAALQGGFVREHGRLQPLDANGAVLCDAALELIQPGWQSAVDAALQEWHALPPAVSLISVYLRGSLPRGLALPGISDVDTIGFATFADEEVASLQLAAWRAQGAEREARVRRQAPLCSGLEMRLVAVPDHTALGRWLNDGQAAAIGLSDKDLFELDAFRVASQAVRLLGADLAARMPLPLPRPRLMHSLRFDVERASRTAAGLLGDRPPASVASASHVQQRSRVAAQEVARWAAKRALRAGMELAAPAIGGFSRDLLPCHRAIAATADEASTIAASLDVLTLACAADDEPRLGGAAVIARGLLEASRRLLDALEPVYLREYFTQPLTSWSLVAEPPPLQAGGSSGRGGVGTGGLGTALGASRDGWLRMVTCARIQLASRGLLSALHDEEEDLITDPVPRLTCPSTRARTSRVLSLRWGDASDATGDRPNAKVAQLATRALAARRRPVVLRGAAHELLGHVGTPLWTARNLRWMLPSGRVRVSPSNVFVFCREEHPLCASGAFPPPSRLLEMSGDAFVERLQASSSEGSAAPEDARYYLQADVPEALLRPDDVPKLWRSVGVAQAQPLRLWASTHGASTPLHFDLAHSFLAQVCGSKRFTFFPPSALDGLYPYPRDHPLFRRSRVELSEPPSRRAERFPRFAEVAAEAEVLELNEGDVVFFPARWWHQVDTTSALSCSVGCRYV